MKNQLHTFSIRSKFIVKQPDDDDDADNEENDDVEFVDEDNDGVGGKVVSVAMSQLIEFVD